MRNREKYSTLLSIIFLFFGNLLIAEEHDDQSARYEWIEGKDVAICEDGAYIDSNKGLMWLDVIYYDKENDRYLIESGSSELRIQPYFQTDVK